MPTCSKCGKPANLFSKLCNDCKAAAEAEKTRLRVEEQNQLAAEAARLATQREQERLRLIKLTITEMKSKLASGEQIFMVESIYLPVDSVVPEMASSNFSIEPLHRMGFLGWQVIQIIPRTFGVALKNTSVGAMTGTTWGAGTGGNVIGVHVLLQKQVKDIDENNPDEDLVNYVNAYLLG